MAASRADRRRPQNNTFRRTSCDMIAWPPTNLIISYAQEVRASRVQPHVFGDRAPGSGNRGTANVEPLRRLLGLRSRRHCRCLRCNSLRDWKHDWQGLCLLPLRRHKRRSSSADGCRCRATSAQTRPRSPTRSPVYRAV